MCPSHLTDSSQQLANRQRFCFHAFKYLFIWHYGYYLHPSKQSKQYANNCLNIVLFMGSKRSETKKKCRKKTIRLVERLLIHIYIWLFRCASVAYICIYEFYTINRLHSINVFQHTFHTAFSQCLCLFSLLIVVMNCIESKKRRNDAKKKVNRLRKCSYCS